MHLLEVKNLRTRFKTDGGIVNAVDGISYLIDEGEIVGLVGESGCGKSVSQLSVMQLIPDPSRRNRWRAGDLRGTGLCSGSRRKGPRCAPSGAERSASSFRSR